MWVEQCSDLRKRKDFISQSAESNVMHRHCCCFLVLFPQWKCVNVVMWTPLLGLQVSSTQFVQCLYFFILSLSHSVFSPSLSCTHARLGSVGVCRMTHLLHTSSLFDHIWAGRKSFFSPLCACVVERSRQCRDIMMSSFLLSPFFCTIFQNKDL